MDHHPAAAIFPLMSQTEYADLRDDIRTHGLREPVWTYEDKILDGRNRARACAELGITPATRAYEGDDPIGFVVSLNLHRRHLNESQRAMVAARLANLSQGRPPVKGANLPLYAAPEPAPQVTNADAAEMLNVSARSVRAARQVQAHAAPELVEAVDSGKVSVSAAAQVAALPAPAQQEIVAQVAQVVPEGQAKVVRAAVKAHRLQDEYTKAVAEFPELAPGNSPGLPQAEVVRVAEGLRSIPEGPERERRRQAAATWHKVYGKEQDELDPYGDAVKILDAVGAMTLRVKDLGGVDTFRMGLQLAEVADEIDWSGWSSDLAAAAALIADLTAICQPPRMRRIK